MNHSVLARRGAILGLVVGFVANLVVFSLPSPTNVVALRVVGSPLLFAAGGLALVVPPAALLYYAVVPVQWMLVGWLAGRLLARRRGTESSSVRGA